MGMWGGETKRYLTEGEKSVFIKNTLITLA